MKPLKLPTYPVNQNLGERSDLSADWTKNFLKKRSIDHLKIVFAGTPAFALPCLEALAASKHKLQAIYTQPDRPAGRGRRIQASPVKQWAKTHQIPIVQPIHFKEPQSITNLAALAPDVMIVIAYGLILPPLVLSTPRLGCINVHASLLPRWRGASPIQHALLHGDRETGITIMQMDAGMDTGAILNQVTCPIDPEENASSLHDRLAQLAVYPLLNTLDALATGQVTAKTQDNTLAKNAPKITKKDAIIDWHQSAINIDRQIRAYYPWPIAQSHAEDTCVRIHRARALPESSSKPPGTILSLDVTGMTVATGEKILLIERLQFPGGKPMSIADYLNAKRHPLRLNLVLR